MSGSSLPAATFLSIVQEVGELLAPLLPPGRIPESLLADTTLDEAGLDNAAAESLSLALRARFGLELAELDLRSTVGSLVERVCLHIA